MADTQKKFDDIIRKIALVVKLVNEEVDDEPIESEVNELNDEISDLTCDIIDEKNDFVELKDSVLNAAKESGATEEQVAEIKDILSEIEKQLKSGKPKKPLVDSFFAGLEKIAGAIANGTLLIEKIGALAAFVWDRCKALIQ